VIHSGRGESADCVLRYCVDSMTSGAGVAVAFPDRMLSLRMNQGHLIFELEERLSGHGAF